jgi:hypothetical protein
MWKDANTHEKMGARRSQEAWKAGLWSSNCGNERVVVGGDVIGSGELDVM